MAAPPRRSRSTGSMQTGSMQRRDSARQLASQYAGGGKSFNVKCLGSEEVSDARGDAVAADCLRQLRQVNQELGGRGYLPRATITLQLKGLAVFDERSKSVTLRVPIDQVTYACHDPEDTSVFAVIVRTEQQKSYSGLRLHAFQAEQKTATAFVRSARELFQLMYKIMKAKKRMSGQSEVPLSSSLSQEGLYTHIEGEATSAVSAPPATGHTPSEITAKVPPSDIDSWVFPAQSETVAMEEPSPSSGSPQQVTDEERRKSVMEEWKALDVELKRIAKELGMDDEEAATPSPVPQQTAWPNTRPTPFDTLPSTATDPFAADPFADDFFQKSFDSPSKFNAAIQQSASPQLSSFSSPTPNPTTAAGFADRNSSPAGLFTSTPDSQVQATVSPADTPQHRSSRQEISFALNPFQSSHGIVDPFQSGANAAYDSFSIHSASTNASVDLTNPLYGSQDSSMFPGYQSPFSDVGNPALVTNSLGFSPNFSGTEMHPMATSSQNTSQNEMAGNPFATDFQSPFQFSATGSISDPFQSSHVSPPLSMSPSIVQQMNASIPSGANDPFAHLIPLALEAVEKPESRQVNERSKQPMVTLGTKPSWDTFEDSSKNHSAPELKSPSTADPCLEPAHNTNSHSLETGTGASFESSYKEAREQERSSIPQKNRTAAVNSFGDSIHEASVFSDFDRAFEASGRSNTDTSQAFEGSLTMKPAEAFADSRRSSKASFEDQFSPAAVGQVRQPLSNTDTHGFGDDFTSSLPSTSWVSF